MAQSKRWCFTLNNYVDDDIELIRSWETKYIVFGKELSTTLTPHLQGFVIFTKNKRLRAVKKLHDRMHWEIAKGTSDQAADYCKKEGLFEEHGVLTQQGKRTDLEMAIDEIKSGTDMRTVADNHSSVYVKFSRGLKDLALTLTEPYEHSTCRGIWIHGPPGTGKSHAARCFSDSYFLKSQSKWFDGYNGEDVIILDDLDTNVLGHYLKIWTDKWACTGETKGGTIPLRHKLFVVTTNYTIEKLWAEDPVMAEALKRRFKTVHKTARAQLVDFLALNPN